MNSTEGSNQEIYLLLNLKEYKWRISSILDMLLLTRLFHLYSIRHSSHSREFFANLKKFYRSTTSNILMATNQRTCFVFDQDQSTKIQIQMIYEIPATRTPRKFNLLRSVDESVSQTIRRLIANIDRVAKKETKSVKRRTKENLPSQQESTIIQLLDENNQPIDENLPNKQAWLNCRKLFINEQIYQIEYNAPGKPNSRVVLLNQSFPSFSGD